MTSDRDRLDRVSDVLRRLPPEIREPILSLVEQLARDRGVSAVAAGQALPADSVERWVAKLRIERKSERTVGMYRYLAGRFLRTHPTPTRLDVQGYLASMKKGGSSDAYVENTRKAATSLFRFLCEEGLWHEDPTAGIKHIRTRGGEKAVPTEEDIRAVMEVGLMRAQDADKMRLVVTILATTGLRLTECMSLRKENIDLAKKEITVVGKGGKRRVVPLLQQAVDMLRGYAEARPSCSLFLFPGDTRTGHAEIYNIEKTLRRACKRAGVKPFTPHGLRHFYATHMLRAGAKIEVVSRILGHSSVGITGDIYRHVRTGEMHEEAERFGPLNGQKPPGQRA